MNKFVILFFLLVILISFNRESSAWFFTKPDNVLLEEAVKSNKPGTVERCLMRQIKIKNFAGILKLRRHARQKVRAERNKLNTSKGITPQELKKNIAPWLRIEQKATQFYKLNVK